MARVADTERDGILLVTDSNRSEIDDTDGRREVDVGFGAATARGDDGGRLSE